MKKKLLSLVFLAIAICLSISIGTSVAFASTSELTRGEISEVTYFANVNKSIEIYDAAVSPYQSTARMRGGEDVITIATILVAFSLMRTDVCGQGGTFTLTGRGVLTKQCGKYIMIT